MGGLFIAVVMFFPNGLAGLWNDYGHHVTNKFRFITNMFSKEKQPAVASKLEEQS